MKLELTTEQERAIHELLAPFISGENTSRFSNDELSSALEEYHKQEQEEMQRNFDKYGAANAREMRMEQSVKFISLLTDDERGIIEKRMDEENHDNVTLGYEYSFNELAKKEFDMPEEHVIFMLCVLKGAFWYANVVSAWSDPEIQSLL